MRILRPSGHLSSVPARGRRTVAVAVAAALVLAACGRDPDVTDVSAPALEAGQPIDVRGRAGLVLHDVSPSGTFVFPGGSAGDLRTPADDVALQEAAEAVRAWLDAVLSERNRGLTTTVERSDVDAAAFARAIGADGAAIDGALEVQVANATYLIEIAYLGRPGWSLARVESILVTLDDPGTEIGRRLDSFVFTIDEAGALEFIALEVAP